MSLLSRYIFRIGWPSKTYPPKKIGKWYIWIGPYLIGNSDPANNKWIVRDPFPYRAKSFFTKWIYCPIVGHDCAVKMDGTKLCRRH